MDKSEWLLRELAASTGETHAISFSIVRPHLRQRHGLDGKPELHIDQAWLANFNQRIRRTGFKATEKGFTNDELRLTRLGVGE